MYAVVVYNSSFMVKCPLITMCEEEANNKVDRIVKDFINNAKLKGLDYKQVDDDTDCRQDKCSNAIRDVRLYLNDCFYNNIKIFEE